MAARSFAVLRMTGPVRVKREIRGGCAAPDFSFLKSMINVILSEVRAKDLVAIPVRFRVSKK